MSIMRTQTAKNEREQFEAWWNRPLTDFGCVTKSVQKAAWEAWKARALIEYPHAFDCEECDGTGDGDTSGDPQNTFPCSVCEGEGVVEWP